MKRLVIALTALITLALNASAMSYEQARDQALFLTDKMAYELNLSEEQYDAAYEINLDYLMSVKTPDDLYEEYWRQRNLDLSYILLDWQYHAFCAAAYFYRPLYWASGVWHFAIYARYPRRNYLFFGRTNIYITYRGGHSWRHNGGRSWYKGRTFHHGSGAKWHGLRDRFDHGDFRHHNNRNDRFLSYNRNDKHKHDVNRRPQSGNNDKRKPQSNFRGNRNNYRNNRESSTRTTARFNSANKKSGSFNIGNRLKGNTPQRKPSNTFTPKRSNSRPTLNRPNGSRTSFNRGAGHSGSRGSSTRGGGGRSHGSFGGKR